MIGLGLADLVLIASRTLGLDAGQVLDLLDAAAAEHALAQARPGSEPGSPADAAAALLSALAQHQPFRRGNQQVALAAMLQFLALNGWDMDPDPPGAVAAMVTRTAAGALDTKDVADWLAPRLQPSGRAAARMPSGRAATRMKEAPMRDRPALPLAERIRRATLRTRPKGMFVRFTDRSRRVLVLAQDEAKELGHGSVGPEHLLLGLLLEGEGVAALVLESLGISLEEVRDRAEQIAGRGQEAPAGRIPFTLPAKRVLERALRESLQLGHQYIGTEHLLLGLLAEDGGVAARVLADRGAGYALIRERVMTVLTGRYEQADPETRLVRLPVPAALAAVTDQLREVRRQKADASAAGDLAGAAALRARERQLRAEKLRLEHEWAAEVDVHAVIAENRRVHRELDRLRALLRQHGIEPDGGTARTA
ncbi:MAG TPA: Clp protease N-terminal domain-containing protein [Trebonia sp.]|nr:Clp protease N-terminal domain-containing protein [Trebonia sp.]